MIITARSKWSWCWSGSQELYSLVWRQHEKGELELAFKSSVPTPSNLRPPTRSHLLILLILLKQFHSLVTKPANTEVSGVRIPLNYHSWPKDCLDCVFEHPSSMKGTKRFQPIFISQKTKTKAPMLPNTTVDVPVLPNGLPSECIQALRDDLFPTWKL